MLFLAQVKLVDKATGKEYVFVANRWLSRAQDDKDIVRELPVMVNNKPVLPGDLSMFSISE